MYFVKFTNYWYYFLFYCKYNNDYFIYLVLLGLHKVLKFNVLLNLYLFYFILIFLLLLKSILFLFIFINFFPKHNLNLNDNLEFEKKPIYIFRLINLFI